MYGWGGLGVCPGGSDGVGAWRHGHWQCEGARTVQLRQTCSGWDFPCSPYGQPAGVSVAACDLSLDLLLGLVGFYPGHCGFPRLTVMELRRLSSASLHGKPFPLGGGEQSSHMSSFFLVSTVRASGSRRSSHGTCTVMEPHCSGRVMSAGAMARAWLMPCRVAWAGSSWPLRVGAEVGLYPAGAQLLERRVLGEQPGRRCHGTYQGHGTGVFGPHFPFLDVAVTLPPVGVGMVGVGLPSNPPSSSVTAGLWSSGAGSSCRRAGRRWFPPCSSPGEGPVPLPWAPAHRG